MTIDIASLHPRPTLLADPQTCGEDHAYNLALTSTYAPKLCGPCKDYHATISVNRITGVSGWSGNARPALIRFVSEFLDAEGPRSGGTRDILIAGAADTSTFSTCAHAVAAKGQRHLAETRFHILDKCETPLTLCRDFARRHNLVAHIECDDLTNPARRYSADMIVMHSLLNFIPQTYHLDILRRAQSWLKPNGRLFIWNAVPRPPDAREDTDRALANARFGQMIEDGRLTIGEDPKTFLTRLVARVENRLDPLDKHPAPSYFEAILADLGFPVLSFDVLDDVRTLADGYEIRRPFLQAVIGKI